MPAEVTLSSAARNSLLALRRTTSLIELRQRRVSSGLRVANAVDDPVAFFKSRALSERAARFQTRKDEIDQGVSTAQSALSGAEGIEKLTRQLKTLADSLKSATGTTFSELIRQFNNIRTQIDTLAADSTYQGVNLLIGEGDRLQVRFSDQTGSFVSVQPHDLRHSSLGISRIATADTAFEVVPAAAAAVRFRDARGITQVTQISALFTFTYDGPDETFNTGGDYQIRYGDTFLTLDVQEERSFTQGAEVSFAVVSGAGGDANLGQAGVTTGVYVVVASALVDIAPNRNGKTIFKNVTQAPPSADAPRVVQEGATDAINRVIDELDTSLSEIQGAVKSLAANVDLLKTRLDFTDAYVKTLTAGAEKYTLADISEETANLAALQTRRSLTLSSLAIAGGEESGIIALLREALSQNSGGRRLTPLSVLENAAAGR